jgi:hypothetical protein
MKLLNTIPAWAFVVPFIVTLALEFFWQDLIAAGYPEKWLDLGQDLGYMVAIILFFYGNYDITPKKRK